MFFLKGDDMLITRRQVFFIFTLIIFAFYGWIVFFKEDEMLRTLGASFFPALGAFISFIVLYNVVRKFTGAKRTFWLLLCIGVFFNFSGNLLWLVTIFTTGQPKFTDIAFTLWLAAYIFFLLALLYKTRSISTSITNHPYTFNIIVFMTSSVAISAHYLIKPIWYLAEDSLYTAIISSIYSITDLLILFLITYLYYLTKYSKDRALILILCAAFILQISADTAYLYLSLSGNYVTGSLIDPIWMIAIMLIAGAAFYAEKHQMTVQWQEETENKIYETLLPYVGVVILIIFVIESYDRNFNFLSLGLLFVFLMVLGRQIYVIQKNSRLVSEYRFLAYHDALTGLKNRASFNTELQCFLDNAKKEDNLVGLLLIDLDRFKLVNDSHGHQIGDELLIKASDRLQNLLHSTHSLYRLGGDEFVVILPRTKEEECIGISDKIIEEFSKSFFIDYHEITISPSIGISVYPKNGETTEQLLKQADSAMYLAKGSGRNMYRFYDAKLNEVLARKIQIENELRKAIEKNQFKLHYQPIVNLLTGEPVGVEALLRWFHPKLGFMSPAEFIPVAEETGQIVSIGEWVLETACTQNVAWQKAGLPPFPISVNVSARQFQNSDFLTKVVTILQTTGLEPWLLELEITESMMQNVSQTTTILKQLREIGVRIAIDDFGTGYSSLHILKELPIDTIKIDKLFVDDLVANIPHPIVKTIIDIGMNLNLRVVAEGIEKKSQVNALTKYNCHFGQGYFYSKPVDAKEVNKFFRSGFQELA